MKRIHLIIALLIIVALPTLAQDKTLAFSCDSPKISNLSTAEIVYDFNGDETVRVIIESEIPDLSFEGSVFDVKSNGKVYELLLLEGAKRLVIRHPNYLTANLELPFKTKGGTLVQNVEVVEKEKVSDIYNLSQTRNKTFAKISIDSDEHADLYIDGIKVSNKTEFYYLSPGIHVFASKSPLGEYIRTLDIDTNDFCGIVDVRNAAYVGLAINPSMLDNRRELYEVEDNTMVKMAGRRPAAAPIYQNKTPKIPFIGVVSDTSLPQEYTGATLRSLKKRDGTFFVPLQAIHYTDYEGYTLPRIYSTLYSNQGEKTVYTPAVRDLITLSLNYGNWTVKDKTSLPDGSTYRVVSENGEYDDIETPFDAELSERLNAEANAVEEQNIRVNVACEEWCTLYIDGEKSKLGAGNYVASPGVHIFESKYKNKKYKIKVDVEAGKGTQIVDVCLGGEIWVYIPLFVYNRTKHELLFGNGAIKPAYTVTEDGYFTANGESIPCKIIKHSGLLGTYGLREETPRLDTTINPLNGYRVTIPGDKPHRTSLKVESRMRVEVFIMPGRFSDDLQVAGIQKHSIINETKNLLSSP